MSRIEKARDAVIPGCFGTAFICFILSALYRMDTVFPHSVNLTWVASLGLALMSLGMLAVYGKRQRWEFWTRSVLDDGRQRPQG